MRTQQPRRPKRRQNWSYFPLWSALLPHNANNDICFHFIAPANVMSRRPYTTPPLNFIPLKLIIYAINIYSFFPEPFLPSRPANRRASAEIAKGNAIFSFVIPACIWRESMLRYWMPDKTIRAWQQLACCPLKPRPILTGFVDLPYNIWYINTIHSCSICWTGWKRVS